MKKEKRVLKVIILTCILFLISAIVIIINGKEYTEKKELMIIPGAVHTDLYDRVDIIPFDKIEEFMRKNMEG